MTNKELKKKIYDIIAPYVSAYGDDERIADALIAAGIGDVSSEKAMRELAEAFHREKCAEYDLINYKLQKAEHRVEVAERALQLMSRGECTFASPEYYREQAEKELAEERKDD